jgi:UDP-N-acetylmuramoyl-tripeptide--D-alanyl-D-alanine ligase
MERSLLFKYRRLKIKFIAIFLDHYVRLATKKHDIKIVAVTGTIGKTSAKVAISQLLSSKHRVHIEDQNHNSDRAIRLNFFGVEFPHNSRQMIRWIPVILEVRKLAKNFPFDVVVIEMAESRHASLKKFISEIQPDIGVITAVSPVHMRYFKSLSRVVEATWGLVNLSKKVIYNSDFRELKNLAKVIDNNIGYGIDDGKVKFTNIKRDNNNKLTGQLSIGQQHVEIHTNFIAEQSLYSLLAAATTAIELGWDLEDVAKNAKYIKPVNGRMNTLIGKNNSVIIDDSFNASPIAVKAALKTLSEFDGYKIAVLGSMNELGDDSAKEHAQIGALTAKIADIIITVGSESKKYLVPAAVKAGFDKRNIYSFNKSNQVGDCLNQVLRPKSTILFKGSQGGIYIEEAIKFVMKDPSSASETLVRQKKEWLRRKKNYFSNL